MPNMSAEHFNLVNIIGNSNTRFKRHLSRIQTDFCLKTHSHIPLKQKLEVDTTRKVSIGVLVSFIVLKKYFYLSPKKKIIIKTLKTAPIQVL